MNRSQIYYFTWLLKELIKLVLTLLDNAKYIKIILTFNL